MKRMMACPVGAAEKKVEWIWAKGCWSEMRMEIPNSRTMRKTMARARPMLRALAWDS